MNFAIKFLILIILQNSFSKCESSKKGEPSFDSLFNQIRSEVGQIDINLPLREDGLQADTIRLNGSFKWEFEGLYLCQLPVRDYNTDTLTPLYMLFVKISDQYISFGNFSVDNESGELVLEKPQRIAVCDSTFFPVYFLSLLEEYTLLPYPPDDLDSLKEGIGYREIHCSKKNGEYFTCFFIKEKFNFWNMGIPYFLNEHVNNDTKKAECNKRKIAAHAPCSNAFIKYFHLYMCH